MGTRHVVELLELSIVLLLQAQLEVITKPSSEACKPFEGTPERSYQV